MPVIVRSLPRVRNRLSKWAGGQELQAKQGREGLVGDPLPALSPQGSSVFTERGISTPATATTQRHVLVPLSPPLLLCGNTHRTSALLWSMSAAMLFPSLLLLLFLTLPHRHDLCIVRRHKTCSNNSREWKKRKENQEHKTRKKKKSA